MAGTLDKVDVHDAGDKIILSCEDEATLRYVVEELKKEGRTAYSSSILSQTPVLHWWPQDLNQ